MKNSTHFLQQAPVFHGKQSPEEGDIDKRNDIDKQGKIT